MMSKVQVQVVVAVVILVFVVGIVASGGTANPRWLKFYSYAVTAALIVLGVWDRYLWRVKPFQKLPFVPRDIRGTWKGTIVSEWVDPNTNDHPPTKQTFLVVRQTWSTVSLKMFTDEMRSDSTLAKVAVADRNCTVEYLYLSKPRSGVEKRSRMHPGTASLELSGSTVTRLHGRYWTDRETRGELEFTDRRGSLADDFDSAVKMLL